MAEERKLTDPGDAERFRFLAEQRLLGREITAIEVDREHVTLFLGGDSAIRFSVSGTDIRMAFAWVQGLAADGQAAGGVQ